MSALTIGSLFSGIGGLELGLERAGLGPVVWQVEREPYCRAVLAKHWPDAARYDDVCTVGAHNLAPVDVIAGGYPCQPFSTAGRMQGANDARHLWPEFARILGELRPRYAVLENVAAHLALGFDTVLGDLAALGYDAEWSVVSACAVGAPHVRERLFVVAYAAGVGQSGPRWAEHASRRAADRQGQAGHALDADPWAGEPPVPGMAHGVPSRLERLTAPGNAVVPQVAEVVGRVVLALESARAQAGAA